MSVVFAAYCLVIAGGIVAACASAARPSTKPVGASHDETASSG